MPETTEQKRIRLEGRIEHLTGSLNAAVRLGVPIVAVLSANETETVLGIRKFEMSKLPKKSQ